jgi:UPF0042 nucleotide-binding protein
VKRTEAGGRIVLVTGMSGAGRSSTLNVFEDLGFEAVDNLPLSFLGDLIRGGAADRELAIGVDIRTRDFDGDAFKQELERLRADADHTVSTIFLDCDEEVLVKRYTETRRRHPLAADRPLAVGIRLERRLLAPIREFADTVIDTSELSPWMLKRQLVAQYGREDTPGLSVVVTSFSYRRGVPREADMVFDARFLRNPHYDDTLRPLTGRDSRVGNYIEGDPDYAAFMGQLMAMFELLLPRFESEGKSYLTIAIGCTGGRHRSVYLTEQLGAWIEGQNARVQLYHRDLEPDEDAKAG